MHIHNPAAVISKDTENKEENIERMNKLKGIYGDASAYNQI